MDGLGEADALAALIAREGFRSPDLFVQRVDPLRRAALVLHMSRSAYRAASFLDDRGMHLACDGFVMPHDHLVRWTQALADEPKPIHFIFHAGHVGSTLISRLIDEADGVLGLREPLVLRTLATAHDALAGPGSLLSSHDYETWFATHLRLWRRGYGDTRCVVVKATSDTARIGHKLMNDAPEARAILLNVTPETYLAQSLSAHASKDVQSKLPERQARVARLLGGAHDAGSPGEAVALSWLAEQLTHDRIAHPWPHRVLRMNFNAFLTDPSAHLAAILRHLRLEMPQAPSGADFGAHPLMRRYSKCPDRAYSPADRAERLAWSQRENASEIRKGLAWLERVARFHPHAATALAA